MRSTAPRVGVGERAPHFALPSIQGATIDLAAYRGQLNVIVWFSRGFTCPFCLMYMDGIRAGYEQLAGTGTEVIQIEQGVFLVDRDGVIRHVSIVGPIDPVPDGAQLTALVNEHCSAQAQRT